MKRMNPHVSRAARIVRNKILAEAPANLAEFQNALREFNVRKTWNIYKELPRRGIQVRPDDHSRILISKCQHLFPLMAEAQAAKVLVNMRNSNVSLDIRDYHSLMFIHLHAGSHDMLLQLHHSMYEMDRVRPDVQCYNFVMASHLQYDPRNSLPHILEVWRDCNAAYPALEYMNADGWAYAIEAYGHAKDIAGAKRLLSQLESHLKETPVQVDAVVYEAMIRAFALTGDLPSAIQLFETKFATPTLHQFDAIIEACSYSNNLEEAERFWELALELCTGLARKGLQSRGRRPHPLGNTIKNMLAMYCHYQNTQMVDELFKYHWYEVMPDVETMEMVVTYKLDSGQYEEAKILFKKMMVKRGYLPTLKLAKRMQEAMAKEISQKGHQD